MEHISRLEDEINDHCLPRCCLNPQFRRDLTSKYYRTESLGDLENGHDQKSHKNRVDFKQCRDDDLPPARGMLASRATEGLRGFNRTDRRSVGCFPGF